MLLFQLVSPDALARRNHVDRSSCQTIDAAEPVFSMSSTHMISHDVQKLMAFERFGEPARDFSSTRTHFDHKAWALCQSPI